jgi:two-component system, chemotaxis family, protein-glutamate methylesterase/glutaminase
VPPAAPIRVLIADDSSLVRGLLRSILQTQPDIEVVGEATNGQQAIELTASLRPHLVTMDLEMPGVDGLQAIEAIMCSRAVPIVVVSSAADALHALQAVEHGALEVIAKPDTSPASMAAFVAKVRMLAGVAVITRLRPRTSPAPAPLLTSASGASHAMGTSTPAPHPLSAQALGWARRPSFPWVFAMAASTGGPQVLAQILPGLPVGFSCPVLVAQHISDGFAQGMVDWLASLCRLPVQLAREGQTLQPGMIYIAPSERNLAVTRQGNLHLPLRADGDPYHPRCDVLLEAVAQAFGAQAVGIVLSGMGHDGAAGMAAIAAAGGRTWAQDEASSLIFGMNQIAIARGAVQQVLAPSAILAHMCALGGAQGPGHG